MQTQRRESGLSPLRGPYASRRRSKDTLTSKQAQEDRELRTGERRPRGGPPRAAPHLPGRRTSEFPFQSRPSLDRSDLFATIRSIIG
jgi:hypothetical protein